MENFSRNCCRRYTGKFFDSAQKFFDTAFKTVNYMFDNTFLRIFPQKNAVFQLKFTVDCGTRILDVQKNNLCKKFLECAGTSYVVLKKRFWKGAKVPFYKYFGVV